MLKNVGDKKMLFMKKILKITKIFAVLIVLGTVTSAVNISAVEINNKNSVKTSQSSEFHINDSGELVSYTGKATKVIIPKNVKKINCGAFSGHSEIQEILFSKKITCIDDYAFYGCSGLKEVILPESLKTLGRLAFGACESMEKIYIGSAVSDIMELTMCGCCSLKNIEINPKNKHFKSIDGIMCTKDGTALLTCPLDKKGKITIPDTVVTIKECAFYDCKKIEEVCAGNNLKYIDEAAFYGCENLKTVNFGDSIKKIRAYAFANCASLEKFNTTENLTSIGNSAFCGCKNLKEISILSNNIEFCHKIFEDCSDVTIKGHSGSNSEAYALKYKLPFQNI